MKYDKIKVKDLIKMEIDVDVCDDYDESCYIAFCGPLELTPAGLEMFAPVLEYDIELPPAEIREQYGDPAIITGIENDNQARQVKKFFYAAAGYCSADNWSAWFKD